MRKLIIVVSMALGMAASASAQVSLSIGLPGVRIGINVPVYPELVRVPGYPVYYAPQLQENFFFYDGMYWVYEGDNWYASDWYNGPWSLVGPDAVPLYILRVPVRYFRNPPGYFRGWQADAPPRWGEHWGNAWQQRRPGWDRWNRASAPAPAPLPSYQMKYPASRYPQAPQQEALRGQNYRYQPRDAVVRQHFQEQAPGGAAPAPQHQLVRPAPMPRPAPAVAAPQRGEPAPREQRQPAPQEQRRPEAPGRAQAAQPQPGAVRQNEAAPGRGQSQGSQGKPEQGRERQGGEQRDSERR